MKRLLLLAAGLWVGRWAVLELAAFAARRLPLPRAQPRNDREPGRMPGPVLIVKGRRRLRRRSP